MPHLSINLYYIKYFIKSNKKIHIDTFKDKILRDILRNKKKTLRNAIFY